ncbi:MAG: NUDIX hydrolase [Burkholderiaceae bacterium]|jgi:8-oxo-dGTP pyrophosphatase MutT (NUDIX family)
MTDSAAPPSSGELAPPRPAASLVLLRDADGGLEVLMLERTPDDNVLAGAHVFPGGKLDREDGEDDSLTRFDVGPAVLHTRLGEPELEARESAALFVAAVRECFEETGVLLARGIEEAQAVRARALRRDGHGFTELMSALDLRFDATLMEPWSRWITPKVPAMMRKRFDTRFFIARLPEGQAAEPDLREAVAARWMAPRDALRRYSAQEIDMAAPQIMTLAHLSRFPDVATAMAEAARRPPPVIRPEPIESPEGRLICYPGDPAHPVRERAMPGPTRLLFAGGRFRPEGGFDAWFE